jgi:serine/threonine protein kinase
VNKVQDALKREEVLKQTVPDEKNKHLEAIGAVEMAKNAFTHETYSKHQAENAKAVDALLSTGKSCRRYSKHEIELATDYFSDAKKIGEGGYGNVYRCTLDHTEVAVKVVEQDSINKIDEFLREVRPFICC